ncbi:MAG TPA: LD-carboxypeptidase [Chitinophagales bacterium]|nr:LD-carboxypeptidase [Chitinophagales bacterium]
MKSITPSYLKPGDKIAIVSTARKLSGRAVDFAVRKIRTWKLNPVLGKTVGIALHQFAGDDWTRAGDFQRMLDDDEIKAILCARGGYGTVRIIDKLDFQHFRQHPKWLIGFSDITVLHAHIHSQFNIESLHASMPLNFSRNTKASLDSLRDALFGKQLRYHVKPHRLNVFGKAKGQLVGGNLSVLYSISASRSDLMTAGKILFLEDVDEYLYHIDRMMMQLKRSGKLRNLAGMIIGSFTKMKDNRVPYGKNALEIVAEHAGSFGFPLAFGFPAGHIDDNRTLIMGRNAELIINKRGSSLNFL